MPGATALPSPRSTNNPEAAPFVVQWTSPRSGSVVGARANMTALRSFFARGEHPSPPMEVRAGKLAENVTMQRL